MTILKSILSLKKYNGYFISEKQKSFLTSKLNVNNMILEPNGRFYYEVLFNESGVTKINTISIKNNNTKLYFEAKNINKSSFEINLIISSIKECKNRVKEINTLYNSILDNYRKQDQPVYVQNMLIGLDNEIKEINNYIKNLF